MTKSVIAAVVTLLISCTGDDSAVQCGDGEHLVRIATASTYEAARVRSDGGSWRDLVAGSFCASDTYDLTLVCDFDGFLAAYQYLGSVSEATPAFVSCEPVTTHTVTGQVAQSGSVSLGSDFRSAVNQPGPWTFELSVPAAEYSLLATTHAFVDVSPPRVAIRRGVVVSGDIHLGVIDFMSEGFATDTIAITATGRTVGDTLSVSVHAHLKNTFGSVSYTRDQDIGYVIPASMLAAGEAQHVSVSSARKPFGRSVDFDDWTADAALPPEWEAASVTSTGSGFEASWTSLAFGGGAGALYESSSDALRSVTIAPSRLSKIERVRFDETAVDGYVWDANLTASIVQYGEVNGQYVSSSVSAP